MVFVVWWRRAGQVTKLNAFAAAAAPHSHMGRNCCRKDINFKAACLLGEGGRNGLEHLVNRWQQNGYDTRSRPAADHTVRARHHRCSRSKAQVNTFLQFQAIQRNKTTTTIGGDYRFEPSSWRCAGPQRSKFANRTAQISSPQGARGIWILHSGGAKVEINFN